MRQLKTLGWHANQAVAWIQRQWCNQDGLIDPTPANGPAKHMPVCSNKLLLVLIGELPYAQYWGGPVQLLGAYGCFVLSELPSCSSMHPKPAVETHSDATPSGWAGDKARRSDCRIIAHELGTTVISWVLAEPHLSQALHCITPNFLANSTAVDLPLQGECHAPSILGLKTGEAFC
jgi:hypothetical protein